MLNTKKLFTKILNWLNMPIAVETVQKSATINANTGAAVNIAATKQGYTPLAVVGIQIAGDASGSAQTRQWRLNGTDAFAYIWNVANANKTWTITMHVLYVKKGGGTA